MLRLRPFVSLVVLLSMLVPLLVPAASARQVPNVSTPEAAAIFYSQLEAAGSFSLIYQYMHPDAQSFIPKPPSSAGIPTSLLPMAPA